MLRLIAVICVLLIASCADVGNLLRVPDPLFTLAPYPQSSGCSKPECRRLDALEAKGYELARGGKITWVKLVDTFYTERDKLFPDAEEESSDREYRSYQRVLAEQMDTKRITEAQWVYLLEKKKGELSARGQMLQNSKPRTQNCVTEKVGLPPFESYKTRCN